eukprot:TRINITY_DN15036_c0_g4_i2.p1 TRINITY_DN15036_c0_g4~~TRINITY_DN15036_c0_g4_i2.p1  ORF type:complete len:731 (+),score=36.53 TRINITY_DN15036_c0_g4_i2:184-2376(+)
MATTESVSSPSWGISAMASCDGFGFGGLCDAALADDVLPPTAKSPRCPGLASGPTWSVPAGGFSASEVASKEAAPKEGEAAAAGDTPSITAQASGASYCTRASDVGTESDLAGDARPRRGRKLLSVNFSTQPIDAVPSMTSDLVANRNSSVNSTANSLASRDSYDYASLNTDSASRLTLCSAAAVSRFGSTVSTDLTTLTCRSTLSEELLRGVDIREALRGFGRHWRSIDARPEDYSLSAPVDRLSAFVSHDWQTPRGPKTLTLLFYKNMWAAVILSCLSAALCPAAMRAVGIGLSERDAVYQTACGDMPAPRPYSLGSIIVATLVFVCVFAFGQRLRNLCYSAPCMIFLDKLCIHQTDSRKKSAGILGLAAWLAVSDKMVILWSERYFTRLWCTYELAAWCKLGKSLVHNVSFVPVVLTNRLACCALLGSCVLVVYEAVVIALNVPGRTGRILNLFQLCFVTLYVVFLTHQSRELHFEVKRMRALVEHYNMSEASCFCCSHDHIHPETGDSLCCDRELVMRTLREWRARDTDEVPDEDGAAEYFNDFVRSELRLAADALVSPSFLFKYGVLVSLPMVWQAIARATGQVVWVFADDLIGSYGHCALLRFQLLWFTDLLQQGLWWRCVSFCAKQSVAHRKSDAPVRLVTSICLGTIFSISFVAARVIMFRVLLGARPPINALYSFTLVIALILAYWPRPCVSRRATATMSSQASLGSHSSGESDHQDRNSV